MDRDRMRGTRVAAEDRYEEDWDDEQLADRYGGGVGESYAGGEFTGRQGGGYGRSYGSMQTSGRSDRDDRWAPADWREQHLEELGPYAGQGPLGYQRSRDRIIEDVNEALTWAGDVDASDVRVTVDGDEVTLEGTVDTRRAKRAAEHAVERVRGVADVHNHLRLRRGDAENRV